MFAKLMGSPGRIRPYNPFLVAIFIVITALSATEQAMVDQSGDYNGNVNAAPLRSEAESLTLLDKQLSELVEDQNRILEGISSSDDSMVVRGEMSHRMRTIVQRYESIISTNPNDLIPLLLYGRLLRQIGERERAHEIYMRANAIDPRIAVVKQQIGNYFAEAENPGLALPFYLAAIELAPDEPVYHYTLGEFLFLFRDALVAEGVYEPGTLDTVMLRAFRIAAELAPNNPDFQFRHAEAYYDLHQPDWTGSLAAWDQLLASELTPSEIQAARLHRARVLVELGRFEEAKIEASRVTSKPLEGTREKLLERIAAAVSADSSINQ